MVKKSFVLVPRSPGYDVLLSALFCGPCLYYNATGLVENRSLCIFRQMCLCLPCILACNRRHIVRRYSLSESCPQTFCLSMLCPPCSVLQEFNEVALREGRTLGKPCRCCCCCCRCVWSAAAAGGVNMRDQRKIPLVLLSIDNTVWWATAPKSVSACREHFDV